MGLLRADQIRNAAGTGNADLYKQWATKAWANLNGTGTIALRDSDNIASVTDNGTGDYTFNLTTAMANTNYLGHVGEGRGTGGTTGVGALGPFSADPTTSAFRAFTYNSSFSAHDAGFVYFFTVGDLT